MCIVGFTAFVCLKTKRDLLVPGILDVVYLQKRMQAAKLTVATLYTSTLIVQLIFACYI